MLPLLWLRLPFAFFLPNSCHPLPLHGNAVHPARGLWFLLSRPCPLQGLCSVPRYSSATFSTGKGGMSVEDRGNERTFNTFAASLPSFVRWPSTSWKGTTTLQCYFCNGVLFPFICLKPLFLSCPAFQATFISR